MTGVDILWSQIDKGRRGENIGVSTGIPKLDKVIGGVQPSRYYCISAQSSAGWNKIKKYLHLRNNIIIFVHNISLIKNIKLCNKLQKT